MNISRRQFFSAAIASTVACKVGPIQYGPTESVLGWAGSPGPKWEGYDPSPSDRPLLFAENGSVIQCVKTSSEIAGSPHCIDWIVVG